MNKVLVPVDFSDTSMNALFYAIGLFRNSNVEITVLNTYAVHQSAGSLKSMYKILQENAQSDMDAFMKKVRKEEPDFALNPKVMEGESVSTISSLGNGGKYDFITMGTKGASGLKEVFMGSVAGGVISRTTAPVLVVPGNYKYSPLDEIVLAVSNVPISSEKVVEPLRKITKHCTCKVKVLHITEEKAANIDETLNVIKDLEPTVVYDSGTGSINTRINNFITEDNTKLLCLIRRKVGFFGRIFNDSVTLKQTFNSTVPILILHD